MLSRRYGQTQHSFYSRMQSRRDGDSIWGSELKTAYNVRWGRLAFVALLAIGTSSGCGSEPEVVATPPSPSIAPSGEQTSSSSAASASESATPGLAETAVIKINPFGASGEVRDPYKIDLSQEQQEIDCTYGGPSLSALSANTYSCGSQADSANACWISAAYPDHLLCLQSAWGTSLVARRLSGPVKPTSAPDKPEPLGLELEDGTRWRIRLGGSWGARADGYAGAYGCDPEACTSGEAVAVLADQQGAVIDDTSPVWTVRVGELGDPDQTFPSPETIRVRRVWYIVSS